MLWKLIDFSADPLPVILYRNSYNSRSYIFLSVCIYTKLVHFSICLTFFFGSILLADFFLSLALSLSDSHSCC